MIWETLTFTQRLILLKKLVSRGTSGQLYTYTGALPATITAVAHAIASLTRYGKVEQRNLPAEYTELDYIQSNGSQYIDLNTAINQDDTIEIEFEITSAQKAKSIFGYRAGASSNNIMLFFGGTTNQVFIDFNNSDYSAYRLSYDLSTNTRYKAVISKNRRAILAADGTVLAENTTACPDTITCPNTYLFAAAGSPAYADGSACKVYSCVINGKRNLVGAKDASNVVEMYDKVSAAPFVNAGTGSFTAGPDTVPSPEHPVDIVTNNGPLKVHRPSGMPIAYQMVEWLKPAGYIPITGFKTKSTQEIECVFYREQRSATYLYSSDTATSGTTNTTAYLTTGAGNWRWDGKSYSVSVSSGIKITSIQNKDGVWLNGTQYGFYTDAGDFVSTNDLRLSSGENDTVRIYAMTIHEGETVTLDLVPVQRLSDSAYGFYDKVSGNFYGNADATFEAGPVIDDPVEVYEDGIPEVLTVSGENLFDQSGFATDVGTVVTYESFDIPNGTYTFSTDFPGAKSGGAWYTNVFIMAGEQTSGASTADNGVYDGVPRTITVTDGKFTVAYRSTGTINTNNPKDYNWMLAAGSSVAEYEPYVQPQTVTVPMLLGLGDYKDEWEAVQGPLTHIIGLYVIKGSDDEGWAESPTYSGTFYADCLPQAVNYPALSMFTRYKGLNSSTSLSGMTNGTAKCGSSSNRQRIFIRDVSCADVDALKAKLSGFYADGEPCIVAFVLATEATEQTTPHNLVTHKGVNVVDSTANVEPVEAKIEYYGTEAQTLGMMMPEPSAPEEPANGPEEETEAEEGGEDAR